jgi:hypothetical protein
VPRTGSAHLPDAGYCQYNHDDWGPGIRGDEGRSELWRGQGPFAPVRGDGVGGRGFGGVDNEETGHPLL